MLRRNGLGMRFRRQHPIGPYVLDFYCASAKLCVEVDGPAHAEQVERDERRAAWLKGEGITVLRFSPEEIEQVSFAVLRAIEQAAPLSTTLRVVPLSRRRERTAD